MSTTILETDAVWVVSAQCHVQVSGPELFVGNDLFEVCLLRNGCFDYRDRRGRVFVDTTTCVFGEPRHECEISHPVPGGDLDTLVFLTPAVLASLGAGDTDVPLGVPVTPAAHVVHQQLLAAGRAGADPLVREELALDLVARLIAVGDPARMVSGMPRTTNARRRLVDDARSLLVSEPGITGTDELARRVGCSPHHLSRLFREHTGRTIGGYRIELRVAHALDLLRAEGPETTLAQIATDTGFADHAHLTRTVRRFTGWTPSALRSALADGPRSDRPLSPRPR